MSIIYRTLPYGIGFRTHKNATDLSFAEYGIYMAIYSYNGCRSLDELLQCSKETPQEVDMLLENLIKKGYLEKEDV